MQSNFTSYSTPHFRVLSDDQLQELHWASLEVLQRTGFQIDDEEGLELFRKAGAYVDGNRVRLPTALVERAIRTAPSSVALWTKDGRRTVVLEGRKTYYGTGSDAPNILDSYTGERRKFRKEDVVKGMILCDYLPHIDFVMSMGLISDVPWQTSDLHQFEAMLLHTWKPVVFTALSLPNCSRMVDMAVVVAGSLQALQQKPFICLYAEPISPLLHDPDSVHNVLFMAERNLPLIYCPGMMAGATGPVTLAGSLVLANAEMLSSLTLTQLKREGAPFIYGGGIMFLDMRTAVLSQGAPEFWMGLAAMAEMGHYYNLPIFGYAGLTDAPILDEQAAIESAMSIFISALSGAHLVHDVCYLDTALVSAYEVTVLGNEIIAMVKEIMKGIEFTEETMALDVIDQVGPAGNYLGEEHTLKHFRDNWYPELLFRGDYKAWVRDGKLTLGDRVNRKVKEILETYSPKPFPEDVQRKVREILEEAETGLR